MESKDIISELNRCRKISIIMGYLLLSVALGDTWVLVSENFGIWAKVPLLAFIVVLIYRATINFKDAAELKEFIQNEEKRRKSPPANSSI